MEVACLAPISVGLVRWFTPAPTATLVLKATFSLAQDGWATLTPEQVPLHHPATAPPAGVEVHRPNDFVPIKAGCDVLVVGHAHSPEPTPRIDFGLRVGGLDLRLAALSNKPKRRISLYQRKLVDPYKPERRPRLAPIPEQVEGWAQRTLPGAVDFSRFNVALREHRVTKLAPDATLELDNLLARAPRCAVQLPGVVPEVYFAGHREGLPTSIRVEMLADTLWIDADAALCTVTWRGMLSLSLNPGPGAAVVALGTKHAPLGREAILERLHPTQWAPLHDPVVPDDAAPVRVEITPAMHPGRTSPFDQQRAAAAPQTAASAPQPVTSAPLPAGEWERERTTTMQIDIPKLAALAAGVDDDDDDDEDEGSTNVFAAVTEAATGVFNAAPTTNVYQVVQPPPDADAAADDDAEATTASFSIDDLKRVADDARAQRAAEAHPPVDPAAGSDGGSHWQ